MTQREWKLSRQIDKPNFTQTPNSVLDNMPEFSDAELRVLLCVCRQTFGWQRGWAKLSLSFIAAGTGMSTQGVFNGLKSLRERGFLGRRESGDSFSYELLVSGRLSGQEIVAINGVDNLDTTTISTPFSSHINGVDRKAEKPINAVDTKKERGINKEIKKGGKSPFQKPSVEEVVQFCLSLSLLKSDGEAFFWGKEGNGWKNGSNPVKDWKATIRQWKASGYHPSQKKGGQNFTPPTHDRNKNY